MCGINGFNFKNKKLILDMNETISHRGPDSRGDFVDDNLSFGHLRLAILDLSPDGFQPMKYKHLVMVFNGELYNYEEVKEVLIDRGYEFTSTGDSQVLMAAYLEWGEDCVKRFNGMWAFAIYDTQKNTLFLSRDRYGKKPLYYYFKDNQFIFSSEIKAIIKYQNIDKTLNSNSIHQYFNYRFTYNDNTFFKYISNFKASHNMIFDLNSNKIKLYKKYYSIQLQKYSKSYKEAKKDAFNLLDSSVKYRMVSDVPVATFLSGGIDSSLVTYFAKKYNSNLNTFSVGFDTTNELSYAKIVAKHLKTNHREFIINKDNVMDYIYDMVYHMDEPIGADPGFLPLYVLSQETSKYNRVVLSGDGADEIFTGYDRYKLLYYGRILRHFSIKSSNQIMDRLHKMRGKNMFESFFEITRVFDSNEISKLKLKNILPNFSKYDSLKTSSLNKIQLFDIDYLLLKDFFMKSDKMSSAFGLEMRTPFMDKKVVEFALSLPIKYRLFGWKEKRILKDIAHDILPKEIWMRRKHGFNVPIDYWFENVLGDELKTLMRESSHNLYKQDYVYELLDELKENSSSFKSRNIIAQKLWSVLVFEIWYKKYVE